MAGAKRRTWSKSRFEKPMPSLSHVPISGSTHPGSRDESERKLDLLETAARRWLGQARGGRPGALDGDTTLHSRLEGWMATRASGQLLDDLPALATELGQLSTAQATPRPESLLASFAHALVAQALSEVSREAARAGRLEDFNALSHFLDADPDAAQMVKLKNSLSLADGAIAIALSQLRRRLQHRVEAAITLWSGPDADRNELRRKLRESLTSTESRQ